MIQANDITKAVMDSLKSDANFNEFTIERSEFVNMNPALCPWIGVYRGSINYLPETLGQGPDHWTGIVNLRIVVQAVSMDSGEDAEDELEDSIEKVVSKLFGDTTLDGSVDMLNELNITYSYVAEEEETIYFQAAIIEATLEVSTS